jgi:uncharacterized protein YbjQ (UPF0145 family)
MLQILVGALLGIGLLFPAAGEARDTKLMLSIEEGLSTPDAKEKLQGDVRFYFGDQPHPAIAQSIGEWVSNHKTNALNKTDKAACEWVFLSAMLSLQKRAHEVGADAVVNIQSYYRKVPVKSRTQYECHAGATVAGVALRGDFVKLAK